MSERVAQTSGSEVCGSFLPCPTAIGQIRVSESEGIFTRSIVNPLRRLSSRTVIKKNRSERKGRRNRDTALEYTPVDAMTTQAADLRDGGLRSPSHAFTVRPLRGGRK